MRRPTVAANISQVDGSPHVFLANFTGLVPGKIANQTPVSGIRIRVPASERQHARIFAVSRPNSDAPRHAKRRTDRVHSAAGRTRRNRLDDWKIAVGKLRN